MNGIRTSRRVAALAALPATVLAWPSGPAAAEEPQLVERCWTIGLSDAEVAAGEVSDITCEWVPADQPRRMARGGTFVVAIVHDGIGGGNPALEIIRDRCDTNAVFPPGGGWNNRISSTTNVTCGNAKHFVESNFTGYSQTTTGPSLLPNILNWPVVNDVSSIAFG